MNPTDRDALIERVTKRCDRAEKDMEGEAWAQEVIADVRALIALVSGRAASDQDPDRIWVHFFPRSESLEASGLLYERPFSGGCAFIRADLVGSLASPSPVQWPEDVVERVKRALLAANVNAHGLEDPDALARAALATLPPPEDERVKGLVEALQYIRGWDELHDALPDHVVKKLIAALASYRGGA